MQDKLNYLQIKLPITLISYSMKPDPYYQLQITTGHVRKDFTAEGS